MTMPGIPYIYMGDEIGMRYVNGVTSKEGGYGRCGARTPMQWNSRKNAGFSTAPASRLYLPLDSARNRPTIARQDADKHSLLNHVRRLAELRKMSPALSGNGEFLPLHARSGEYPFVYLRRYQDQPASSWPSILQVRSVKLSLEIPDGLHDAEALLARGASLRLEKQRHQLEMKAVSYGIFRLV